MFGRYTINDSDNSEDDENDECNQGWQFKDTILKSWIKKENTSRTFTCAGTSLERHHHIERPVIQKKHEVIATIDKPIFIIKKIFD